MERTAKQFKEILCHHFPDALATWYRAPQKFVDELKKIVPALREEGIAVGVPPDTTLVTLSKLALERLQHPEWKRGKAAHITKTSRYLEETVFLPTRQAGKHKRKFAGRSFLLHTIMFGFSRKRLEGTISREAIRPHRVFATQSLL